jgi:hypothetical protein
MKSNPEINTYSHPQIFLSANLLKKTGVLIRKPGKRNLNSPELQCIDATSQY